MFAYGFAALFFVLFLVGVLRDRRRFGNAVYLGLALVALIVGLIGEMSRIPRPLVAVLTVLLLLAPAVGVLVLAGALVSNGVTMVRREGIRPANLLSLLTGLAIVAVIALLVTATVTRSRTLIVVTGTVVLVVGYVSFLLLCFVGYAFLYERLRVRRSVDFVVVLGSGLVGGDKVPPLLAGRLDRARALFEAQVARGNQPVLITSGGRGPDEDLPESHAMADHLIARGFPAERIVREDRSRNTEENLLFSKAIMTAADPVYRCVIVTNNFHAFRAALLARRTGVRGQVVGAPTASYFRPSATIREFVAVFLTYKVVNLGVCLLIAVSGVAAWLWR
ncbi:YdcF family protein (plasmid) [Embleya sp. NBC_00888]|uniref:YdcF family protein n=1 Tax=Embleya sp. NBC_00888 TaxID=2975960 RepID=UPI002F912D56|nr:YdcF family protein [Embleya sp. NBC_00888]